MPDIHDYSGRQLIKCLQNRGDTKMQRVDESQTKAVDKVIDYLTNNPLFSFESIIKYINGDIILEKPTAMSEKDQLEQLFKMGEVFGESNMKIDFLNGDITISNSEEALKNLLVWRREIIKTGKLMTYPRDRPGQYYLQFEKDADFNKAKKSLEEHETSANFRVANQPKTIEIKKDLKIIAIAVDEEKRNSAADDNQSVCRPVNGSDDIQSNPSNESTNKSTSIYAQQPNNGMQEENKQSEKQTTTAETTAKHLLQTAMSDYDFKLFNDLTKDIITNSSSSSVSIGTSSDDCIIKFRNAYPQAKTYQDRSKLINETLEIMMQNSKEPTLHSNLRTEIIYLLTSMMLKEQKAYSSESKEKNGGISEQVLSNFKKSSMGKMSLRVFAHRIELLFEGQFSLSDVLKDFFKGKQNNLGTLPEGSSFHCKRGGRCWGVWEDSKNNFSRVDWWLPLNDATRNLDDELDTLVNKLLESAGVKTIVDNNASPISGMSLSELKQKREGSCIDALPPIEISSEKAEECCKQFLESTKPNPTYGEVDQITTTHQQAAKVSSLGIYAVGSVAASTTSGAMNYSASNYSPFSYSPF